MSSGLRHAKSLRTQDGLLTPCRPLVIKKCQDDHGFDITQTEIVGSLFASAATIRVIQASAHPSVRDSIPPTSALRFDPLSIIGQKRGREASPKNNGASYHHQKRQKVSDIDPDEPIQSREDDQQNELRNGQASDIIPNSQESVVLGENEGRFNNLRQVRPDLPVIPETPPPPSALNSYNLHRVNTDQYRQKVAGEQLDQEIRESSPAQDRFGQEREHGSSKKRSASYHIHRTAEGGRSVSTAATSPLFTDFQQTGESSTHYRRMVMEPLSSSRKSKRNRDQSVNDDNLYDDIVSDLEGPSIMKDKRAALRNGSPTTERGRQYDTPPRGQRRSREKTDTPGELPLTPNSKEREQLQKERREAEAVGTARRAAALAAEERQRVADQAREAERERQAEKEAEQEARREQERAAREEQVRFEVEEFKKNETERIARLKEEQEARQRQASEEKRNVREARRVEKARLAREDEERREEQELKRVEGEHEQQLQKAKRTQEAEENLIAQDAKEVERNARRNSKAHLTQLEQVRAQVMVTEEDNIAKIASSPPDDLRFANGSSPDLPRAKPFVRANSTTGFYPNGRKSALKQVGRSSSPATPRATSSIGVGIEAQMPLPQSAQRRVSFESTEEIRPVRVSPAVTTQLRTPKAVTPKPTTSKASPASATNASSVKSASKSTILPPTPLYKRIVPPPPNFQERKFRACEYSCDTADCTNV